MAQREGSVYLYLFIVAGILFVIMTVLFFVTNSEKQREGLQLAAEKRRSEGLERDREKTFDEIRQLKALIVGEARADEWNDISQLMGYALNDELKGKGEKAINEILTELSEAQRSYSYLTQPYADLGSLMQRLIQAKKEALAAREVASTSQLNAKKESDGTIETMRSEKQQVLGQLRDVETRYEDLDNTAKTREADLVTELETVREEFVDQVAKLKRVINWKDNEIRSLQGKLERIQEQIRKEEDIERIEPDGKIQYVIADSGKAWVDIGRSDHLTKGMRFRVFQTVKGGRRVFKGSLEVVKLDEDMSEARVIEELNSLDPIVAGDYIASPFFDRDVKPVFVFAGSGLESRSVTQQLVIAKMQSYGAVINKDVDEKTDYVVAMKDYENTPEYKTARELQTKIIRERDLLDYLGF